MRRGVGALFFADQFGPGWFQDGYVTNVFTEALSIGVTVFILNLLAARRAEAQRKEDLIVQMSSPSNEFALMAVRILYKKGWLTDGSLQGADLYQSNLQGAKLLRTNLQTANLSLANLQGAILASANLQDADLHLAKLQGAILEGAKLQGTKLRYANLQGADLVRANLQSANLSLANLQGAKRIDYAHFDENTILPDGSKWDVDVDMTRFTNPNHSDFWPSPHWQGD